MREVDYCWDHNFGPYILFSWSQIFWRVNPEKWREKATTNIINNNEQSIDYHYPSW